MTVTLTQPDGTVLNQPTAPYDPTLVVQMQNGSLIDVLVTGPEPGVWTIQVESTNTDDEYQFFLSTIPTADVQSTIDATLSSMADPAAMSILAAEGLGDSWKCFWCKFGCYALGVLIAALVAAGLTYVTAGAGPIIALGTLLSISAPAAYALVAGLIAGGVVTVGILVGYICAWANACPTPSAATS